MRTRSRAEGHCDGGADGEDKGQVALIAQFVEQGWLKIRDAKPTVVLLKAGLMRRFNLLKETGTDDLLKKPTLQGNIRVVGSCLDRVSTDGNTTYPLRFDSERRFVRKKIASVLDSIANEKEKEREAKMQEGEHMKGHDDDQDAVDPW